MLFQADKCAKMREIGDILLSYDAEFVVISSTFLQLRPSLSIHSPQFLIINNVIKEKPGAFLGMEHESREAICLMVFQDGTSRRAHLRAGSDPGER